MKLRVAITDNDWFRFLRSQPELDEVNFWQPSGGRAFHALDRGEPFLFKLHAPHHFIVGGGFFAHFCTLSYRTAWEWFGEKNGAPTLEEMRRRIEKYRRTPENRFADYKIGCILLVQPFFFDEGEWIPVPADFSKNIQQGKNYDLSAGTGADLWREVQLRLAARVQPGVVGEQPSLFGEPTLVRPRLGQGTFRAVVLDTYEGHCAITGEKALPALEAAHIRPVSEGGRHDVPNGLLFRSDVHRLFDSGYFTVTPDYRFRVSRKLKEDFDNGEPYFPLAGQEIWRPKRAEEWPGKEFLEWHADTVFRG